MEIIFCFQVWLPEGSVACYTHCPLLNRSTLEAELREVLGRSQEHAVSKCGIPPVAQSNMMFGGLTIHIYIYTIYIAIYTYIYIHYITSCMI